MSLLPLSWPSSPHVARRSLLFGASASGLVAGARLGRAQVPAPTLDHTIRIAPLALEIGPGKVIRTTGYNGTVPGPAARVLGRVAA